MARAVADPALDLATPFKGLFQTVPLDAPEAETAALRLAWLAGLLPQLFVRADGEAEARVAAGRRGRLRPRRRPADRVAARLPNRFAEQGEIVAFRSDGDTIEHAC